MRLILTTSVCLDVKMYNLVVCYNGSIIVEVGDYDRILEYDRREVVLAAVSALTVIYIHKFNLSNNESLIRVIYYRWE